MEKVSKFQGKEVTAMMGTLVLVGIVAVIAAVLGALLTRTSKRFGLKEAESAQGYIGDSRESANAVMGVVVGVLGYENRVSEDVDAALAELDKEAHEREQAEKTYEEQIRALEAQIEALKVQADTDTARVTEIRATAKLFS